ncbi:MAG: alpha/beta hydrolase [Pseudomonadota bacterium]
MHNHEQHHQLEQHGVVVAVTELNPPGSHSNAPTVVMVHGLRDTAEALRSIAQRYVAAGYRVLLPHLRGHGRSGHADHYAMPSFLLDLAQVYDTLCKAPVALFGHSLGGHIVSKYAALFPEQIRAAMIIEGLGPPTRRHEGDEAAEIAAYRFMLQARTQRGKARSYQDLQQVSERLLHNNPRMSPALAAHIAPHLTRTTPEGLTWNFDPIANSVFIGSSQAENAKFWRQVQCPTCLISGTLSYEYWGREMADPDFSGRFAEGEMEQRAKNFAHHEHHWFEHSGHMVHYDEPDRLADVTTAFLEQYHV